MRPSTSVSISNCTTASATLRRKSPSPALASSSASGSLSSVIGSSQRQVEASQVHLSRPIRWPPQSGPDVGFAPPVGSASHRHKAPVRDDQCPPQAWTLPPEDLSREFELTAQSISTWVAQADKQEGRREEKVDGLAAAERDELVRLRREK